MVKTAEKDAATSPESPFFDTCGIEKSGGSVIAQSSRKQRSVSMARWYLTQCALSDVFRRGFFIGRKNSLRSRVWKAQRSPAETLEAIFPEAVSRILPPFMKGVY